jgi:hypothetical protein
MAQASPGGLDDAIFEDILILRIIIRWINAVNIRQWIGDQSSAFHAEVSIPRVNDGVRRH